MLWLHKSKLRRKRVRNRDTFRKGRLTIPSLPRGKRSAKALTTARNRAPIANRWSTHQMKASCRPPKRHSWSSKQISVKTSRKRNSKCKYRWNERWKSYSSSRCSKRSKKWRQREHNWNKRDNNWWSLPQNLLDKLQSSKCHLKHLMIKGLQQERTIMFQSKTIKRASWTMARPTRRRSHSLQRRSWPNLAPTRAQKARRS